MLHAFPGREDPLSLSFRTPVKSLCGFLLCRNAELRMTAAAQKIKKNRIVKYSFKSLSRFILDQTNYRRYCSFDYMSPIFN